MTRDASIEGSLRHLSPSALRARFGGYSALARWYRRLRPRWAWERTHRLGKATRRYVDEHGLTVRRGPFAGLVYPADAVGTVTYLTAKLIGSYELEIAPLLAEATGFELFVDVGAGDGYYCVGFKRLFPKTRVIGYETDGSHRRMAASLAQLNDARVEMHGAADPAGLNALPRGRLLLLADVEGYEYELLDPVLVPRLRDAMMIIELHPEMHPDIVDVLTSRFGVSHELSVVTGTSRNQGDYNEVISWEPCQAQDALTEGRPDVPLWLVAAPTTP